MSIFARASRLRYYDEVGMMAETDARPLSIKMAPPEGGWPSIDNPETGLDEFYIHRKKDGSIIEGKVDPHGVAGYLMKRAHFITMDDGEGKFTTYIFDGGIYVEGGGNKIHRACELALGDDCNNSVVNEVLGHVRRKTLIKREDAESHPDRMSPWLCLENGIINVHTKEFRQHNPDMIFMSKCPVKYDPDAKCPLIEKFIIDILTTPTPAATPRTCAQIEHDSREVQKMFQWIGYQFEPGYMFHKGALFVGDGGNGKTTLIEVIIALLGPGNVASVSFQGLDPTVNRFAGFSLYGRMANIYDDIGAQQVKDDSTFKIACGGGTFAVERKFKDPITFHNRAKLAFSANNVPPSGDDSTTAYYRRWLIFMFKQNFEGSRKIVNMKELLTTPEELSGLLNMALDALAVLRQQGEFTNEGSVEEIRKQYDELSDPVSIFVEEMVEESQGMTEGRVTVGPALTVKEDLFNAYQQWAEARGAAKLSEKKFTQLLIKRLRLKPGLDERKITITGTKDRKNAWVGIKCIGCEDYGSRVYGNLERPEAISPEVFEIRAAMDRLDPGMVDQYERLLTLITAKARKTADYIKADPANEGLIRKLKDQRRICEDSEGYCNQA